AEVLVDWLWFSAVGYPRVVWTSLAAEAALFVVLFAATAVVVGLNGWFAWHLARPPSTPPATASGWQPPPGPLTLVRERLPWRKLVAGSAALLALFVAAGGEEDWTILLQYLFHVPFGSSDPVYGKDIGFYLFALPAYVQIKNWMMLTLILSALFAGAIHLLHGDNGVVVGASYTDIHVQLPVLWLLVAFSIIAAFASAANVRMRTYWLPAAAVLLVFGGSFVLSGIIPALFRHYFVRPSELQLEKPYIERNIALTRKAYDLDRIVAKPFAAEQTLTYQTLQANKATIDNIRLWDWRPLYDTYAQL